MRDLVILDLLTDKLKHNVITSSNLENQMKKISTTVFGLNLRTKSTSTIKRREKDNWETKTLEIACSKCLEASISNPLEKSNSPIAIEALANSESFSAANLK